jgi:hypothetical protein
VGVRDAQSFFGFQHEVQSHRKSLTAFTATGSGDARIARCQESRDPHCVRVLVLSNSPCQPATTVDAPMQQPRLSRFAEGCPNTTSSVLDPGTGIGRSRYDRSGPRRRARPRASLLIRSGTQPGTGAAPSPFSPSVHGPSSWGVQWETSTSKKMPSLSPLRYQGTRAYPSGQQTPISQSEAKFGTETGTFSKAGRRAEPS